MRHIAINPDTALQEIREALATVCDPELDEPVTELGFIRKILVDKEGDVFVSFRLPTYWCSPNFAYLMASDMREAIARLPWASKISIELIDHFTSAEVSGGASSGKSFRESFPAETEENLDGLRLIFRRKSFQKRQELLLRYLLSRGETIDSLTRMSPEALDWQDLDSVGGTFRTHYLSARALLGLDRLSPVFAFHNVEGQALDPEEFTGYLLQLRRVRLNTEFNSTICRGLLEVRYGVRQDDGFVQIEGMAACGTRDELNPLQQAAHRI